MARVEIYTTKTCPFCIMAKELLDEKGAVYEETDVSKPEVRAQMKERAGGKNSVPQIFINGVHVGGCDDIHALDEEGKLDALLAG